LPRKKPGFPLQFLSLPGAGLRDFRFNPWRAQGLLPVNPRNKPSPRKNNRTGPIIKSIGIL
jgi:hypothetical protein